MKRVLLFSMFMVLLVSCTREGISPVKEERPNDSVKELEEADEVITCTFGEVRDGDQCVSTYVLEKSGKTCKEGVCLPEIEVIDLNNEDKISVYFKKDESRYYLSILDSDDYDKKYSGGDFNISYDIFISNNVSSWPKVHGDVSTDEEFVDLRPLIEQYTDFDEFRGLFVEELFDACMFDGKLYAIPIFARNSKIAFDIDMAKSVWGNDDSFPAEGDDYQEKVSEWVSLNKLASLELLAQAAIEVNDHNESWNLFYGDYTFNKYIDYFSKEHEWTNDGLLNSEKLLYLEEYLPLYIDAVIPNLDNYPSNRLKFGEKVMINDAEMTFMATEVVSYDYDFFDRENVGLANYPLGDFGISAILIPKESKNIDLAMELILDMLEYKNGFTYTNQFVPAIEIARDNLINEFDNPGINYIKIFNNGFNEVTQYDENDIDTAIKQYYDMIIRSRYVTSDNLKELYIEFYSALEDSVGDVIHNELPYK